jgi:N-methylhydantoinase A
VTEQEPRRRAMRIATDVGGTFTDLVIEDGAGRRSLFKSLTTPDDPVRGVFNALGLAAADAGLSVEDLLGQTSLFIHGTTRATNAIIVGDRARTAFLTTQGHPNVLLWREGGKMGTFDHSQWFPEAYVSSALTWEVPERIGAGGEVVKPLDEDAVLRMIEELRAADVEAVAVCLLWSIMNGASTSRASRSPSRTRSRRRCASTAAPRPPRSTRRSSRS